jgi:hypothetical protein
MANNAILIQGLIELHLKGEGGEQAVASMTKIVEQAKKVEAATGGLGTGVGKVTSSVSALDSAFVKLGATMATTFAASKLIGFLQDSFIGFARTERQARVVENQIKSLGQSAEGAGFRGFIAQLSQTTGILDDDLIPAFQRAITAFRDYGAAQGAVQIASRFAAAGVGDVGSNVEALTSFFQTGIARGLKPFISNIKGAEDGTISWAEVLPQLEASLTALGQPLDDAQKKLDNLRVGMDFLADSTGEVSNAILDVAIKAIPTFLEIASTLPGLVGTASGAALEKLRQASEQGTAAQKEAAQKAADQIAAFNEANAKRAAERKVAADKKSADDVLKAEADRLEKVAALEQDSQEKLLKARADFYEAGSSERINLELELLAKQEAAAVASAKKIGADTLAIAQFYASERGKVLASQGETKSEKAKKDDLAEFDPRAGFAEVEKFAEDHQEALTKIYEDGIIARLKLAADLAPEGSQEKLDAQAALQKAQLQIESEQKIRAAKSDTQIIGAIRNQQALLEIAASKMAAKAIHDNEAAKTQDALAAAGAITGALGSLFGKSKGFAIAMAVINTALGITSVWKDDSIPTWYAKLAATLVVAASGAAQIAAIRSASPSGGGASAAGVASAPTSAASNPAGPGGSASVTPAQQSSSQSGSAALATSTPSPTFFEIPPQPQAPTQPPPPKVAPTVQSGTVATPPPLKVEDVPPLKVESIPSIQVEDVPPLKVAPPEPLAVEKVAPIEVQPMPPVEIAPIPPVAVDVIAPAPLKVEEPKPLSVEKVAPLAVEPPDPIKVAPIPPVKVPAIPPVKVAPIPPVKVAPAPSPKPLTVAVPPPLKVAAPPPLKAVPPTVAPPSLRPIPAPPVEPAPRPITLSPLPASLVSALTSIRPTQTTVHHVVNIGTAFGDRQSMTKLAREINRVNANNQSVLR